MKTKGIMMLVSSVLLNVTGRLILNALKKKVR
ncbi:hypothetical protein SAMN05216469_10941 [Ruminococcus albus]|uniref:Uncharacterized protein n=1 Tax=Ruminococcus albus TaxID=1264 RepID=A0A1H7LIF8_RUMAL|nr:hypothetical protein SAMN05216469_10941 [Ruminococcus albus]